MVDTGKRQVFVDATLDFASIAANESGSLNVTMPARLGDAVHVVAPPSTAAIKAQGTLTLDTIPTDGDTMTIDTKVYTWQDTLTNVDGNVYTGGSLAQAKLNIVAAMDLSGTAGTDYATAMTAHPTVDMGAFTVNDAVLTAKTPGAAGNAIATTETYTPIGNVFDAATLGTTTAGDDSSGTVVDGYVSATDTVTVRALNTTGAAVDLESGVYRVLVWS
jgi:hypothetical protein